ncbi:nuclear transport factor 2 family protein [Niabella terrae]
MVTCSVQAQTNETREVEKAVETLRQVLLQPDKQRIEELAAPWLSYGHSSGEIENRATFTQSLFSGKFTFSRIQLKDQTISIRNDIAIVRHQFLAATRNKGSKPGQLRLGVLLVFQKIEGRWLLIARQAFKL